MSEANEQRLTSLGLEAVQLPDPRVEEHLLRGRVPGGSEMLHFIPAPCPAFMACVPGMVPLPGDTDNGGSLAPGRSLPDCEAESRQVTQCGVAISQSPLEPEERTVIVDRLCKSRARCSLTSESPHPPSPLLSAFFRREIL